MVHGRTKQHPEEIRTAAISQFRSCQNVAHLARQIGIPRQTLYRWIDESERVATDEDGELVSAAKGRESRLRKRISQLKQVLANKTLEADFFRGALQRVKARHRGVSAGGELASTTTRHIASSHSGCR
jgi:transposase-like protein